MFHVVSGYHLIMWFHNSCGMDFWNPSKLLNITTKTHEIPTALDHYPGKPRKPAFSMFHVLPSPTSGLAAREASRGQALKQALFCADLSVK